MDVSELETLYSLPSPAVLTRTLRERESLSSSTAPSSMSEASFLADEEEEEFDREPRRRERRGTEDCTAGMVSSTGGAIAPRSVVFQEKRSEKAERKKGDEYKRGTLIFLVSIHGTPAVLERACFPVPQQLLARMEATPPLRLSVEERVDQAVREAVRRALANQRRTQEQELDALSDVLQR